MLTQSIGQVASTTVSCSEGLWFKFRSLSEFFSAFVYDRQENFEKMPQIGRKIFFHALSTSIFTNDTTIR
jgi:hypothetical protein